MAQAHGAISRLGGLAVYGAIRAGIAAACVPSAPTLLSVARRLGGWWAAAPFNRKRLARAVENLAVAFPEWDGATRRRFAVGAYEHMMMLGVELAYTPRLLTLDEWAERVRLQVDPRIVQAAVDGRPVIFITGHCGNWELSGYILALLGFRVHALYRPLDLEPLDRWVRQTRQRRGLELLDKFGAARHLPEILSRGDMLGFIADQNGGDRGLFVPFFDRLASSYKAIGVMATRYGATVICGMARRLDRAAPVGTDLRPEPRGMHYAVTVEDVFGPEEYGAQPDPVFYITARYRRAIEACVRRAPEQYLWMHRYWKSRPRHERFGRPFPASLREKLRALPWMTAESLERIEAWSARDAEAYAQDRAGRKQPEPAEAEGDDEGM
ncbi:MAG: hypothetical protein KIT68_01680 [Phycisphaeraceae bacterium]|nr:hypothetical protein [Phycisphaeraceae bacterium]